MPKKDIVLDSSFLMVVSRIKLSETLPLKSLLGQFNVVVPKAVVRELEKVAKGKSIRAKNAMTALQIAQKYEMTDEVPQGNVDDTIIELAQKRIAAVATLDAELMASLKTVGVAVITLRKNRLVGLDNA